MTVYNGEKFLKKQMDSFLNQTRLPDEIIVADDCSSDKTEEILKLMKKIILLILKFIEIK